MDFTVSLQNAKNYFHENEQTASHVTNYACKLQNLILANPQNF